MHGMDIPRFARRSKGAEYCVQIYDMGYYDLLMKMNDAKEQLDRIADKYIEE